MKHFFLSLAAATFVSFGGWAQCTADFDFMGAPFGVSPNPALGETFVDGEVGQPYNDVMHVVLPSSTGAIPDAPLDVPLDSLILDSLYLVGEMGESFPLTDIGLMLSPNNNGDSGNPNAFLGGNQYCASLTGTPDTAGVFAGQIYSTAWVTVPFVGANAIPFPIEGYTITIVMPAIPGCTDALACNYDAEATEDDGSCTYAEPLYDCDGNCINDANGDGICDEVGGCTDADACNYNASASVDDGSCEFPAETYLDCDGNCVTDSDGDGVCDELEVPGCDDMDACNYDEMATDNDGSCDYAAEFYDCDGNCLMDTDGDGVCDELEVAGCTDMMACNYDEAATDDDGSCAYPADYYDCDGNCLNDADGDGVCDELEIAGCTNMEACNYDEAATDDDDSCLVVGDACDDGDDSTENDMIDENCECMGEVVSVDESAGVAFEVYPNPASTRLHVDLPQGMAHELTLFSVSGQTAVATQTSQGGTLVWEVGHLPAGAYLLNVTNDRGHAVRQVMLGLR